MDSRDLKPASAFAINFGMKAIVYGPAGTGKTPIIQTAPRPLLLSCEQGLLSMIGSNVPTYQAFTVKAIEEFFQWFFGSAEIKNYDTFALDSSTQMCEIYLAEEKKNEKHGLKQYGNMAEKVLLHFNRLYFFPHKHIYLIAKEEVKNINNTQLRRPYYPGQMLPIDMPHKFDAILRLAKTAIPGYGEQIAFQCNASFDVVARNRTGKLADFEPPHFGNLITKALA